MHRQADFFFDIDACGYGFTGRAECESGRITAIILEDGQHVDIDTTGRVIRQSSRNPRERLQAEAIAQFLAPMISAAYADEIEATTGWHYDALAEHGLGKHQLI